MGEALATLRERYGPEFAAVLATSRVWVNGDEPADGDDTTLRDDDELAVLPPVSGGSEPTPGAGPASLPRPGPPANLRRIVRRISFPAVSRLAVLVVLGVLLAVVAAPAGAAPAQVVAPGSVADLEQKLRDAQAASDAAVSRFQQATAKHEGLVDEIGAVEQRIAVERFRAGELRAVAQRRAVTAYTTRDVATDTSAALFGSHDVMTEIRRHTLLQHANAKDDAAITELRVLDEDLGLQKADLQRKREEAARAVAQLESEKAVLASTVADAQRAYDELVTRLAREAASRAAAERAAQQAVGASRRTGTVGGTPVAGFLCPVRGSFTNDYGDARSGGRAHAGTDIFAGTGTPVAAVKSGSLVLESGGAGGNAATLNASDGNSYYYAHFSSYAGGARQVSQGEIIGYVGSTGNASAPHLHFEIRTASGSVNPYATLAGSC